MNKKRLHESEQKLLYLLENNALNREKVVNEFTNLMAEVEE